MHSVFFHVLAAWSLLFSQESKVPDKVPPKKAGNWIFSTITVAGAKEPLQIASLPAVERVEVADGKKAAPYLVLYCQRGSSRVLNAFVDWRREVSYVGKASLKLNGTEAAVFVANPLVMGDLTKMSLPATVSPLLREAVEVELTTPRERARFVMLHWDEIQRRLLRSCAAN